ncbi:MAG: S-layer homology domain-containing protein [Lawsonibacter sp.]|nr:S-layer homology domain-containing protein [Lawsonibacter sp.]
MNQRMKKIGSIWLACCLLLALLPVPARAEDGSAAVEQIALDRATLTLTGGGAETLYASLAPDEAAGSTITWTSSDNAVAAVSSNGEVTAVGPGTAVVTASAGGKNATCVVTVSGVVLTPSTLDLLVSNSAALGKAAYGNAVSVSQWLWKSSDSSIAWVSAAGLVTSVAVGTATITCYSSNSTYSADCVVTVAPNAAKSINADLDGGTLALSGLRSQLNENGQDLVGSSLNYVTNLMVPTAEGTLYYGYRSESDPGVGVAASQKYYYSTGTADSLSNITFVPKSGFSGTATIQYTGWSVSGQSYVGEIAVTVDEIQKLTYTSQNGEAIHFLADDFSAYSQTLNGRAVGYVTFELPAARYGTLYYNYTGSDLYENEVDEQQSYYRTTGPALDQVAFVPAEGYTGTFTLFYNGCDTAGNVYSGELLITVSHNADSSSAISYTGTSGKRLYFNPSDFSDASYDATRYQLNYVRFTLPSESRGILYYNGSTKVTSGNSYYRTGSSRLLEDVSFIPDKNFTGTVSIGYTGYDTKGTSFSGTIQIKVTGSGSSDSTISYTGASGKRLYFDTSDFSDASYDETGYQLNYVRFTLPSSSRGVLYYDDSTKVTSGTSYYRTGSSRLLEDVSFIPDAGFTGTVSMEYTGYDTKGTSFSGTITVSVNTARVSNVSYSTAGQAVLFQAADFSAACSQSLSGTLYRVQIAAPDASSGRLCYNFTAPNNYEAFDAQKFYYLSGTPSLSTLSFVPKAGYSGSVYLSFSGEDRNGKSCTNTVRIQVTPTGTSAYFSDLSGQKWAVPAVDFLYHYGIVAGTGAGTYTPSAGIRRGDFVLMLSRAFGSSTQGGTGFSDVAQSSYYASAVTAAKALGIVSGDANGLFHPETVITRQEAAVILYRYLQMENLASAGTQGDLALFSDRGQVSSYAVEAVGALVRLDILSGDNAGNLNPKASLTRAQMAVMLYRALTL